MRKVLYLSVALVLTGAMLIVLSNILLLGWGTRSEAVVVDLVKQLNVDDEGNHWTTYKPELRFTSLDGRVHQFVEAHLESDPGEIELGDTVPVYYWPDDPEHAAANTVGLWLVPIIFIPVAALAGGIVRLLYSDGKRRKKRRTTSPSRARKRKPAQEVRRDAD